MHRIRRLLKWGSEPATPNTLEPVRPNLYRSACGIEGYRRVVADGWLIPLQRRVHDGWVAFVAWIKGWWRDMDDLGKKFPDGPFPPMG